ncbi:TolC family protein [Mucilaginibacter sp.]|uniref:TolC family protein n=1 Tax=Mucilaginibacter sp. TaxID=1882438 RepID=UPI0035BBEAA4
MNFIYLKPVLTGLAGILLCQILMLPLNVAAQQNSRPFQLSLQEAIMLGKSNNNLVKAAQSEENAARADLKDAKIAALPTITAGGDYQRFTSLTLYESFLGGAHSVPKRPSSNGADLNVSAAVNLYSGGRQKAFEAEQKGKRDLATVATQEQTANVALQVVAQYLSMVRLNDQKRFIEEQVIRAQTRLKNINALYSNQKVTRSDVLRAELVLSAVKLNLEQAENDIIISSQKLNVLLNVPDSLRVLPADSANMSRPRADTLLQLVSEAARNAYAVQRSGYNIKIQDARIRGIKSNYAPSLSLFSAYGISYPNTIFYPPVDQAYSIGFVGLKVSYNISSLYQNKNKMLAGRMRRLELNYVQQNTKDNVRQEAGSLLIKYQEALNRISVTEKSIEQARVNYKIVSAKYFNQLALLTDLLDADNLYQESRFNLVQAQTNAQFIYYQLLYTSATF